MSSRPRVGALRASGGVFRFELAARRLIRGQFDATARRFDRLTRAFADRNALQRDLALDLAGANDFRLERDVRHDASRFQRGKIDNLDIHLLQVVQAYFGRIAFFQRDKPALRQATLKGHLATLEADFMKPAGARLLALVAASRRLAETGSDTASHALLRMLGAGRGLYCIELHCLIRTSANKKRD